MRWTFDLEKKNNKEKIAHNFYIADFQTSEPFHQVSPHIFIPKAKNIHDRASTQMTVDQFLQDHPLLLYLRLRENTTRPFRARGGNAITLGVINVRKRIRTRKSRAPLLLFQAEASLLVGIHVKDVVVAAGDG